MNWVLICFGCGCLFNYTLQINFQLDGALHIGSDIFEVITNVLKGNGFHKNYLRAEKQDIENLKNNPIKLMKILNLEEETNNETDHLVDLIINNDSLVAELSLKYDLTKDLVDSTIYRYKVNRNKGKERFSKLEDGAIEFDRVPYPDEDLVRMDLNDRNIVAEASAFRMKVMQDLEDTIAEMMRRFPDPTDIRLPFILNGMRNEYERYFEMLMERLRKTKNYPQVRKYQQWLDFRDQADTMFAKVATKWVNKIVAMYYSYQRSLPDLHKFLKKRLHSLKHEEFENMCRKFGICRSVHAFSEYLEKCIADLISTDRNKIIILFKVFAKSVGNTEYYLYLDDDNFEQIEKYIDGVHTYSSQDYINILSLLRGMIGHRHKPLGSMDYEIEIGTKTFRTILHYLDSAYYNKEKEWAEFAKAFRQWCNGHRDDISEIIDKAIDNFTKYYKAWSFTIRREFEKDVNTVISLLSKKQEYQPVM